MTRIKVPQRFCVCLLDGLCLANIAALRRWYRYRHPRDLRRRTLRFGQSTGSPVRYVHRKSAAADWSAADYSGQWNPPASTGFRSLQFSKALAYSPAWSMPGTGRMFRGAEWIGIECQWTQFLHLVALAARRFPARRSGLSGARHHAASPATGGARATCPAHAKVSDADEPSDPACPKRRNRYQVFKAANFSLIPIRYSL